MALFGIGKKKNLLQQAMTTSWKTEEEKRDIINQLREAELSAQEALPLMWHADSGCRQLGTDVILARPDIASINALVTQMASQPTHIRSFATRLFPRLPADIMKKVVDALLAEKISTRQRLGWEVALSLGGELKDNYLLRAIKEAPDSLRLVALQRLVKEKNPAEMIDQLVEIAKSPDIRTAAVAVEALFPVQDPRVATLMMDRFAHGDATSREVAGRYLREAAARDPAGMRKSMLDLLGEGEDAIRRLAVEILFSTGESHEILLEILMFAKDLVGWLRQRIIDTLRTFGDQVLKPAVMLLQHPDDEVRTAALVLAEEFDDPRITGPVCKLLEDQDWWLRISACDTLGRLKNDAAVPHLVKALDSDETRWAAIDALAQIASNSALKPLANLLRDPREEVRAEVVRAFSRFTDERLLPLLRMVKDKDPSSSVRTRAAEVMRDLSERLHVEGGNVESGTMSVSSDSLTKPLDKLLAVIREKGASDLHITVGEPPFIRQGGKLQRMEGIPVLTAEKSEEIVFSALNERQAQLYAEHGEIDLCYAIPQVGRYRVNAFRQRLGHCAAFRVIPNVPPTFADLRIPGQLTELLDYHQGLIVVSGPAACGKSTTLAAIINLINETKSDHIITLEDPIEFVHPVKTALVNQREVGKHTRSFARALRAALREDPDVIMVGEMRDTETIRMALMAAETGHLVVATLHTTSAIQTVERIVGSFPPDEQAQVRMGLSEALKYVVCQSLIPKKDETGRVAVFEILKGTLSIGNLIRESKTLQLPSLMQIGRSVGMQTVDMALQDLVESGLIAPETAWMRAEKQATFEPFCDDAFLREAKGIATQEQTP